MIWQAAAAGEAWPPRDQETPPEGAPLTKRIEIRADTLRRALLGTDDSGEPFAGILREGSHIRLRGLSVRGELDLSFVGLPMGAVITDCDFRDGIVLENATARMLTFERCDMLHLLMTETSIENSLLITDCRIEGVVEGVEASIGGNLSLNSSTVLGRAEIVVGRRLYHKKRARSGPLDQGHAAREPLSTTCDFEGVKLGGSLFLERAKIVGPIDVSGGRIDGQIRLNEASVTWNDEVAKLERKHDLISDLRLFRAATLRLGRSLSFARNKLEGCVDIRDARIGGQLDFRDSSLKAKSAMSLKASSDLAVRFSDMVIDARGLRCERSFIMRRSRAEGVIRLDDASIQGRADLRGASLSLDARSADPRPVLSGIGVHVSRSLLLSDVISNACLSLPGALITGRVDASRSQITANMPDGIALTMAQASIGSSVTLDAAKTAGEIDFENGTISGVFSAKDLRVLPAPGERDPLDMMGLNLGRASIHGDVRAQVAEVNGTVELSGAQLGADLFLGGTFRYGDDRQRPLNGSEDNTLDGPTLRRRLAGGHAIRARGVRIEGSAYLGRDEVDQYADDIALDAFGRVSFRQARITNSFSIVGARVQTPFYTEAAFRSGETTSRLLERRRPPEQERESTLRWQTAIDLSLIEVGSAFAFEEARGICGHLNLRHAQVKVFRDDRTLWSMAAGAKKYREEKSVHRFGHLILDNFQYESLTYVSPPEELRDWLATQPPLHQARFNTRLQPWTHLSNVLYASGFELPARDIRFDREERRARSFPIRNIGDQIILIFQRLVGYGFRPWVGVVASLILVLIGGIVYTRAIEDGMVRVAEEEVAAIVEAAGGSRLPPDYPAFNPLLFSADRFIPFISFGQSDTWSVRSQPKAVVDRRIGMLDEGEDPLRSSSWKISLYKAFWVFQGLFGFMLTTLTGLAFAGFVQRRKD